MTQAFNIFFTAKGPDVAREVTKKQMSNQSLGFVLVTKLSFFLLPKSPRRYSDLHVDG